MNEPVPEPRSKPKQAPPPPAAPRALWTAALMLLPALVVYLPAALRAGYLDFDDIYFFGAQNAEFREGLSAVLDPSRPIANAWLPVAHLSLWLDWRVFGESSFGPHLVALLLHAGTAAVFVRLLLALAVPAGLAHLAGALFVLHPALAESVAWVSGRKDLLSGLFTFAALLQTVRFAARPRAWRLLGLALLAALAMYSKATAVVLPLLAALLCAHVGGDRRRWLAPAVLLLVVLPIAWHHQALAAAEGTLVQGSAAARLPQVPGAFLHYLGATFWPLQLNVLYPELQTLDHFRSALPVAGPALAALLAVAAVAWFWPRLRLAAFGIGWFVLALLPFNTAYPASSIAAADRYLYLALPGAMLAAVVAATAWSRRGGTVALALLLVPLAYLGGCRAHTFGDDETLWRDSLAVQPANAVARLNLVHELLQRGPAEVETVRTHLEAAVHAARYPVHELRARQLLVRVALMEADYAGASAHARAAIAAARQQLALETSPRRQAEARALLLQAHLAAFEPLRLAGDVVGAEQSCAEARALMPDHPDVVAFEAMRALEKVAAEVQAAQAAGGAGVLAEDDPRAAGPLRALQQALVLHPAHPGLLVAQAAWFKVQDRVLATLRNCRLARDADPQCLDAWLLAARTLRERDQHAEAETYAREGMRHRPDPALRQELALALVGQGRLDDAILQLEAYLRVRPQDQDTAKVLGNVLMVRAYARIDEPQATHAEVLQIVERALACNPKEPKAHLVLGRVAREQQRYADAVRHLETAHRLLPEFEDARRLLAESLGGLGYDRLLQRDDEAAGDAFLRCLAVAPSDFATDEIRRQLQVLWRRCEARGVERRSAGDRAGAIADFRRCLRLDPEQHWPAWLLATTLHDQPDVDLDELEQLCRKALAWQERHGLDRSQQVYLLAATLGRRDKKAEAQQLARAYLERADADAKPQVVAALRRLADG